MHERVMELGHQNPSPGHKSFIFSLFENRNVNYFGCFRKTNQCKSGILLVTKQSLGLIGAIARLAHSSLATFYQLLKKKKSSPSKEPL